jgi:steroid delta-isomerase-like uncharacterized protein
MISQERLEARLKIAKDHFIHENAHDLDALMQTFGKDASFHISSFGEQFNGSDAVRGCYDNLFQGIPDIQFNITNLYGSQDAVIVEFMFTGNHTGNWLVPATGKHVNLPMCAVVLFDEEDKILREKIYFDRLEFFNQIGVEPPQKH